MGTRDVIAASIAGLQAASDVSAPVSDFIAKRLAPTTPPDPAEMLNQIALDKELFDRFSPVLLKLGYSVDAEVTIKRLEQTWTVSVGKIGQEIKFYLLVIPKAILENSSQRNIAAISVLQYLFDRDTQLYMISRDLLVIDTGFPELLEDWTKYKGIKVHFIPWTYVNKFLGEKDEQQMEIRMQQMLRLDKTPETKPQPRPVASSEITPDEEEDVIRIMMQQAINPAYPSTQDYFDNLTKRAYLPDVDRSKLAWKGNAELDARTLVDAAKHNSYPPNHPWAGEKQIGWVLRAVLRDLSPDDLPILANIILKHGLIRDPKVVAELQQKLA